MSVVEKVVVEVVNLIVVADVNVGVDAEVDVVVVVVVVVVVRGFEVFFFEGLLFVLGFLVVDFVVEENFVADFVIDA